MKGTCYCRSFNFSQLRVRFLSLARLRKALRFLSWLATAALLVSPKPQSRMNSTSVSPSTSSCIRCCHTSAWGCVYSKWYSEPAIAAKRCVHRCQITALFI